jgi:2-polyprenyl-3-methyl-5-hydroxy-6-metoxy-1,4-benzoquinol methylase
MGKKYTLVRNAIGFFEVEPKPCIEDLQKHYSNKYYQNSHGSYEKSYSESQLKYFLNEGELALKTLKRYAVDTKSSLLDLGCGEGFFASCFKSFGWEVKCVDFSNDGISRHNPSLLPNFTESDLLTYLNSHGSEISKYGLINLDNVLEHLVDPIAMIRTLRGLIKAKTVVRIEVPNDFSSFQSLLVKRGCTEETWVVLPDHLSYFNKDSLLALLESEGFKVRSCQADFPIEQFLLNDHTNYWKDRSLGSAANLARVVVTNYMVEMNIDRLIDYREAAADLEFGRELTVYVTL